MTPASARQAVNVAIGKGRLVRGSCEECGLSPTHAHHHNGYERSHALDVQWLCPRHHAERHGTAIRTFRERRARLGKGIRELAAETGIQGPHLSEIERDMMPTLAEHQLIELALVRWEAGA